MLTRKLNPQFRNVVVRRTIVVTGPENVCFSRADLLARSSDEIKDMMVGNKEVVHTGISNDIGDRLVDRVESLRRLLSE